MSGLKRKISKAQQLLYQRAVERLAAAGADIDTSSFVSARMPALKLVQVPEILGSYVRVLPQFCVFVIWVRIVALSRKVTVQDFCLSSPEWDVDAWFPDDLPNVDSSGLYCRLPDRSDLAREEFLNSRVGRQGTLYHGDVLEGRLVAQSFKPIPERYAQGSAMTLYLSIVDQFDDVTELAAKLYVDRTAELVRPRPANGNRFDGASSIGSLDWEGPTRIAGSPVSQRIREE